MNKSQLLLKHSSRQFGNMLRRIRVASSSNRPGVLLNSLPKSGTHLLHPILQSLGLRDYQGFFATTPPLTMRVRSAQASARAVKQIMGNELFSAHIFFDECVEAAMLVSRHPSVFIYRDPRAVFVSELNYVRQMSKWHRYYRPMNAAANEQEAFDLLLKGMPDATFFFPPFRERVAPYAPWIQSESCFPIRFEDITSGNRSAVLEQMLDYLLSKDPRFQTERTVSLQLEKMLKAADSRDSHTFTGLDPHRWKHDLTASQIQALEDELGTLTEQLGYQ